MVNTMVNNMVNNMVVRHIASLYASAAISLPATVGCRYVTLPPRTAQKLNEKIIIFYLLRVVHNCVIKDMGGIGISSSQI